MGGGFEGLLAAQLRALYKGTGHASRVEHITPRLYSRMSRVTPRPFQSNDWRGKASKVCWSLVREPAEASAAVATCVPMASSSNFISAAVLDISPKATALKEMVDCIFDRLHSCTQNPRLSRYKLN